MIIKFTNFSDGIHNLEFREHAEKLELGSDFTGDVLLNCEMDKSSWQIVLSCNKEYEKGIHHYFKMIYLVEKGEAVEEDTNIHYLSPDQDKIDLSEDVKEMTLLALPMKHLCDENCKGLCSKCGKDLNEGPCNCKEEEINPVWEPLLKLKDKLNN